MKLRKPKLKYLAWGQTHDGVWRSQADCSNCGEDLALHCTAHTVACCPGRCPVENKG